MATFRIALSAVGCAAVLCSTNLKSFDQAQAPEQARLQLWVTAAFRHVPGLLDDSVSLVANWPLNHLTGALVDFRRLIGRADTEALKRLGVANAPAGVLALKRAALLHADIAILHRTQNGYDLPRAPRPSVLVGDGSELGEMGGTIHWEFARRILDALPAGTIGDGDVRQWYRATAAWLQECNEYAEFQPHLARARLLFPEDPVFMMYMGTMHTAFAEPRIQNALPESIQQIMTRNLRDMTATQAPPPIGPADVELDRAEVWLRKALAQDRGFTEARIRLGYVLSRLGRDADAITELQRALKEDPAQPLRYYAHLLLGRAQTSRRRADLAVAAFEQAATLYPRAQSPRLALSQLARESGDRDRSVRELTALSAPMTDATREDPWWVFNWMHAPNAAEQLVLLRQRWAQ